MAEDVYHLVIKELCNDLDIEFLSIEVSWYYPISNDKWRNPFRQSCDIYATFNSDEDAALFMLHYTKIDIGKI